MSGELATLWAIRLSLLLYALVLLALAAGPPWSQAAWLRWGWAAGCAAMLAHFALAFHHYHGWSHAAALAHTSNETRQVVGVAFGVGVYFNYLFAAVWTADSLWWLTDQPSHAARSPLLRRLVHGYLFFIAFNGAVVFEQGWLRWMGLAFTMLLSLALVLRRPAATRPSTGVS